MVYTQARLEHALQIFRDSKPYRSARGLEAANLERHMHIKYEFRPFGKITKSAPASIWTIRDGSHESDDDYAPTISNKKRVTLLTKRTRYQKRKAEDTFEQERKKKKAKPEQHHYSAFVTLKLHSRDGDPSHIYGEESNRETSNLTKEAVRQCKMEFFKEAENHFDNTMAMGDSPSGSADHHQHEIREDEDMPFDFGHKRLRNRKIPLPESVLVYAKQQNHQPLCNSPCVMKQESVPVDTSQDFANRQSFNVNEGFWDEPPVISNSDKVELKTSRAKGASIDSAIFIDDDEPSSPPLPKKKVRYSVDLVEDFSRISCTSPATQLEEAKNFMNDRLATEKIVTTNYAHPIDFKHATPTSTSPCDFCHDYRAGILGHGRRTPLVLIYPAEPASWIEIEGGHRGEGRPPTKMCVKCALDRLMIIRCTNHLPLTRLPSRMVCRNQDDFNKYVSDLMLGTEHRTNKTEFANRNRRAIFPTCSICPAPAEWKCGAWQNSDRLRRPCQTPDTTTPIVIRSASSSPSPARSQCSSQPRDANTSHPPSSEASHFHPPTSSPSPFSSQTSSARASLQPSIRSCGLMLCGVCKRLVESCRGALDQTRFTKDLASRALGQRADLDFLWRGGLLERAYGVSS